MTDNLTQTDHSVLIAIPVYNGEATLPDTIKSLLAQDHLNFKILICDNLSTDNTNKIAHSFINEYPDRISYLLNPTKGGAEDNWNFLLKNLPLDIRFLALYHADDIYDSTIVRKQVSAIITNGVAAAFTCSRVIDENGSDITQKSDELFNPIFGNESYLKLAYSDLLAATMRYHNFLRTPSFLCRIETIREISPLLFNPEFKSSADLDMWLRTANLNEIVVIKEPLLKYRMSKTQGSYLLKQKREEPADFFKVMDSHIRNFRGDLKNYGWYETYRSLDLIMCALNAVRNNNSDKARSILKRCFHFKHLPKIIKIRFGFKQFIFGLILKYSIFFGLEKQLLKFFDLNN